MVTNRYNKSHFLQSSTQVWTGTYGVLQLEDDNGNLVDIYLGRSSTINFLFLIPFLLSYRWFWSWEGSCSKVMKHICVPVIHCKGWHVFPGKVFLENSLRWEDKERHRCDWNKQPAQVCWRRWSEINTDKNCRTEPQVCQSLAEVPWLKFLDTTDITSGQSEGG